jgi:hypothetical protein
LEVGSDFENQTVTWFEEDLMNRGYWLFIKGSALAQYSSGKGFTVIAGNETQDGFVNGPADDALFSRYFSATQSGHRLLIADFYNNCIRQLDRDTGIVSTLLGHCNPTANPNGDVQVLPENSVNASDNFFSGPLAVLHLPKRNLYLTHDTSYNIYRVDINTNRVTHLNSDQPTNSDVSSILSWVVDRDETTLYVFHPWGLTSVDLDSYSHQLLIGESVNGEVEAPRIRSGPFSQAGLGSVVNSFWLVPDEVIAFGESQQSAIGVIHLQAKEVFFLCSGKTFPINCHLFVLRSITALLFN